MSYLVLARKYRPYNFEGLVGQTHVVQALSNALTQRRLHHAYLFTGTRGVGKTTVSRILAKSLNCTGLDGRGGITASPCGVCSACRDIDAGRFVDYIELDAASNRGVEEISQLLDQAVYKPVVGRFKVYMIDEVHMLSNTAFNAMLKTLEEPPDYLKFVLATTDPQKVPPTVLSRCLQFNLRPMSPPTVQAHLAQVLSNESIATEAGALRLLARAARGSMRDALSLTDQAIAFGAGHLTEDGVRQMLGAVDRSHCSGLLASLAASDGPALVHGCRALREQGIPAAGVLEELAELCQQIAVFQAVPGALSGETEDPLALEAVRRLAGQLLADELQLFYSMCMHGRTELHLAPDEHSALLMIMLRMLAFRTSAPAKAQVLSVTAPAPVAPIREALLLPPVEPATSVVLGAQPAAAPVAPRVPASVALSQTGSHGVPVPPPVQPVITNRLPARGQDDIPPWVDAPEAEMDAAPASLPPEPEMAPVLPAADLPPETAMAPALPDASLPPEPEMAPVPPDADLPPETAMAPVPPDAGLPPEPEMVPVLPAADLPPETAMAPVPPDAGLPPEPEMASVLPAADLPPETAMALVPPDAGLPPEPEMVPLLPATDLVSQHVAEASDQAPQAAAEHPVSGASELAGDHWAGQVRDLIRAARISALVRELAWNAECLKWDASPDSSSLSCVLRVEREILRAPQYIEKLRAALSEHLSLTVELRVDGGPAQDTPSQRYLAEKQRRQEEAETIIHEDPLVRAMLEQYSAARIVPGSIQPKNRS